MRKNKKNAGIVALKARYGMICVSPWILGLVLFFILPVIQSVIYAFCNVSLDSNGMKMSFAGFKNFNYILSENADYMDYILQAVIKFSYSFPVILVISLIIALMLNQNFKGRVFFRALYFLPVIIASGAVLGTILSSQNAGVGNIEADESISLSMINTVDLINSFGLPNAISEYVVQILNGITSLIWNCGIQIVLFISGLQTIPPLLYEVSKVEGATKWEEFWFITFPMLSRIMVLVGVFTMVEEMTSQSNQVMKQAYKFMQSQYYGESSAMLWFYFVIIGAIMSIVILLFYRCCMKKWN